MEHKLRELKKTNNIIQNRIREIINHGYVSNDIEHAYDFYPEIKHHFENCSTSTNIIRLKKGMVSKILSDNTFNRIVCISGKIKIHFVRLRESVIVTPPNTQLIIPETEYIIETLEDSEIISIYKSIKKGESVKIMEQETIYNKKTTNHE
jgi:hypothetical protein